MKTILTLNTDLSSTSPELNIIKYIMRSSLQTEIEILDGVHSSYKLDLSDVALFARHQFRQFPTQSVHLLLCNVYENFGGYFLVANYEGQFFVAPDNGLLSLIFPLHKCVWIKWLPIISGSYKQLLKQLAEAINQILLHGNLNVAEVEHTPLSFTPQLPTVTSTKIQAYIIQIDGFGNAITNLSQSLFEQNTKNRKFYIFFGMKLEKISTIHTHYGDVEKGEIVAFFNDMNLLELAVNQGRIADIFGLNSFYSKSMRNKLYNTKVMIQFE